VETEETVSGPFGTSPDTFIIPTESGPMNTIEHENYAKRLLASLTDDHPDTENLSFEPDRGQSRNAAKAMTEILIHRLAKKSQHLARRLSNSTHEWGSGFFNCRNLSDRPYFFTNIRPAVAKKMHGFAVEKPVAYLLAFSDPASTDLSIWAVPEPLLYAWLSSLQFDQGGQQYPLQVFPKEQRIYKWAESPDLGPYFQDFPLSEHELRTLREAREADSLKKSENKLAHSEDSPDSDEEDEQEEYGLARESAANGRLDQVAQQLSESGYFDPSEVADSHERVLSSIVRRRGQPTFRKNLLAAYNGRCAMTECDVEAVLDAAHIIPYRGEETNHPGNGLLLRTDIHTLFDLKLIAIDATSMCLLVSSSLDGTCYEELRGKAIKIPDGVPNRPSREALEEHRRESGL
jgi:HNH endonuclease